MKLFIQGFPKDFDETDLREMFQLYGEVTIVKIVEDRATGRSKGFGFITMPNDMEAMEVISLFKNAKIKGMQVVVQKAMEEPGNRKRTDYKKW
jgi:RNA recognition motif-containing protein